jgi:hypothetical protein
MSDLKPLAAIASEVLGGTSFTSSDLLGPSRIGPLVRIRQAFFSAAREAGHKLAVIGRYANRGHATVLHGIRAHTARKARP